MLFCTLIQHTAAKMKDPCLKMKDPYLPNKPNNVAKDLQEIQRQCWSHTVSEPYLEWQGVHAMERDWSFRNSCCIFKVLGNI